ncbi:hypothetical protein [Delftia acidovorans]|uniref:hypothetical protein n=1 Tax=Delftia acidovorans TaxID=80866 RepID=UPI0024332D19|nr:hypothetical protein [Delftia acidovorans]
MAPPGTTDPSLGYDAAGNLRGQVQTTNGNTGDATRTTYKYQFNGSYQQSESTTTQGGRKATTNTWRDANGFISNIEQKGEVYDTRYNRAFVNDAQGNALYVNQSAGTTADKGGRIQNEPGGYIGGFIGDAINTCNGNWWPTAKSWPATATPLTPRTRPRLETSPNTSTPPNSTSTPLP